MLGKELGANISKVDVNYIKKYNSKGQFRGPKTAEEVGMYIELLKEFRVMLSTQAPPERYNGIVNLYYVFVYPNATTEEIESTLVNIK